MRCWHWRPCRSRRPRPAPKEGGAGGSGRFKSTCSTAALDQQGLQQTGELQGGLLLVDQSEWFTITMHARAWYTLVAVCDNDCTGLDLVLYGTGHNEIEASRATPVPMIKVMPRATMSYRVKLTLTSCAVSPCWYGIRAYRGITPPPP